ERVDPPVRGERADEADVRALRGLDRAHAAVVRRVDVTDLHAGAVAGQTTRAERGQATLVRQTRERVVLVHELRQLRRAEELLDRRHHGADVDQGLRRDRLDVLRRHALAHDADLDRLAGTRARQGRQVDVQRREVLDRGDDVVTRQDGVRERDVQAEL